MNSGMELGQDEILVADIFTPNKMLSLRDKILALIDYTIGKNPYLAVVTNRTQEFENARVTVCDYLYEQRKSYGISKIVTSNYKLDSSGKLDNHSLSVFDKTLLKFPNASIDRNQTIEEVLVAWRDLTATPMLQIMILTMLLEFTQS
jgi:hypothetical protein